MCIGGDSESVGGDSFGVCAMYAGGEDYGPAPPAPVEEAPGMLIYSKQNQSKFLFLCFFSVIKSEDVMLKGN